MGMKVSLRKAIFFPQNDDLIRTGLIITINEINMIYFHIRYSALEKSPAFINYCYKLATN